MLCLVAHGDDVEIGCGASLLALQEKYPVELYWAIGSSNDERTAEVTTSFGLFAPTSDPTTHLRFGHLRENYFPYDADATKGFVHGLSSWVSPDVIFTHAAHDKHQDHRTLREFVGNAFRNHLVLECEIPKYDGDLMPPNVFIEVTEAQLRRKLDILSTVYASQHDKYWFDESLFMGLAKIRGVEARSSTGYAEAFHGSKLVLG